MFSVFRVIKIFVCYNILLLLFNYYFIFRKKNIDGYNVGFLRSPYRWFLTLERPSKIEVGTVSLKDVEFEVTDRLDALSRSDFFFTKKINFHF